MVADVTKSYNSLLPRLLSELPLGVLLYQGQFDWSALRSHRATSHHHYVHVDCQVS